MLGAPPPSGPGTNTIQQQQNQLLGKPVLAGGLPGSNTPTGSSMFPQVANALSQSPLLQQSSNQIQQMVQALMKTGQRMA